jgi:hypothetical protein
MGPPTWLLVSLACELKNMDSRSRSLSKSAHSEAEWRCQSSGVFRADQLQHTISASQIAAEVYGSLSPG